MILCLSMEFVNAYRRFVFESFLFLLMLEVVGIWVNDSIELVEKLCDKIVVY